MLQKIVCIVAILVFLPLCAAQAGTSGWHIDDNGLKLYFKHFDQWTLVTPANVEDYMDLCTAKGYTEKEVRERFASGRIVWEAYHERIRDGFMRYEVWSDESTRNAWDLNLLSTKDRDQWVENLALYGTENYAFISPDYMSMGREKHLILTGVIKNPPEKYESGYGALMVRNGLGLLYTYIQTTDRASQRSYFKQTFDSVVSETALIGWDHVIFVPKLLPEAVDVTMADDVIVNLHTGDITFRGTTEKGAAVTAAWGNGTGEATAGSDGAFAVSVPVTVEGKLAVSLTVSKKGCSDNRASVLSIPIDNGVARLTLTEYPAYELTDDSFTLSGIAAPGAAVFITLNDQNPVMIIADGNGAFTHSFEGLEDFVMNTLTVTASEEGLSDAAAAFAFYRGYGTDVETGIAKFKAKTISLSAAKLSASPLDYVGECIRMEFRTKSLTRENGGITFKADSISSSSERRYPMVLKAHGYLGDYIVGGMNVTVYGIVEAPTNEDKLPQIRIVYVSYLKRVYR